MIEELFSRLEEIYPEMIKFRREMHQYPELSFQEIKTPRKIANYLSELGLEVRTEVGGRGVVATLNGEKPGRTVAIRADFDALPIQDDKDVSYKSKIKGVMHACGHDIHTSTVLGVAKALAEVREKLPGKIVFIHQFAEEVHPGGAIEMIKDGCLDGVDVIYGVHVVSDLAIGEIGVREGSMTSAPDSFNIKVNGKGGHGGWPHNTVDPILTASQLVVNLQQIVSRNVNPLNPAVVSVCKIEGGHTHNVIPEFVEITGTVRTVDKKTQEIVKNKMKQIVESTCQTFGAKADFNYEYGYPAIINDVQETARVEKVAQEIIGEDKVIRIPLIMGGEDFARYLQKVPGTFFTVGGRNPEINAVFNNHHPLFDVDEKSMLIASKVFVSAVLDYLNE